MSPESAAERPEAAALGVLTGQTPAGTIQALPQRDRMLLGMAQTIAKHGYRGATITEVVRFAKVSKRTFYEEFGDKESCFLELYAQTKGHLESLIKEASLTNDGWRERIRAGTTAYYAALTAEPKLTHAFFIEIATLSPRATQVRREAFDNFAELLVSIVERGRAEFPEVASRPLTTTMAVVLMGGVTEVLISAIERDELAERTQEIVDVFTDLLATAVTGQFPPED